MKTNLPSFSNAKWPAVMLMLPALVLLLSGCIGMIPCPQLSSKPVHGNKLNNTDTAFVRVGSTSAKELFSTLGTNCVCDPGQRAIAYPWEMPGGRALWWVIFLKLG